MDMGTLLPQLSAAQNVLGKVFRSASAWFCICRFVSEEGTGELICCVLCLRYAYITVPYEPDLRWHQYSETLSWC